MNPGGNLEVKCVTTAITAFKKTNRQTILAVIYLMSNKFSSIIEIIEKLC